MRERVSNASPFGHGTTVGALFLIALLGSTAALAGVREMERPSRSDSPLPKGIVFPNAKDSATDPVGDTLGTGDPQIDVTSLSAQVIGDDLVIAVVFTGEVSTPTSSAANALDGFIDIDADQDGSTGQVPWVDALTGMNASGLGNEFYVDLFTYDAADGGVDVVDESTGTVAGRANADFNGASLNVTIPLDLLGGDNAVDVAIAVGTVMEIPTDIAPNQGSVASAPGGGNAIALHGGRFTVEVDWRNFEGATGVAKLVSKSDDSMVLYFFDADNWEFLLKVLDGCDFNGHYWVFAAATTNVEYTITVTDTLGSEPPITYGNGLGQPAQPVLDTTAFATCP